MGRKQKYASEAERQKAYRERKRNAPPVTKCPRCGESNCIAVSEEIAKQFGVYCSVLCFECNGLISDTGAVWEFHGRAHDLPNWIAFVNLYADEMT